MNMNLLRTAQDDSGLCARVGREQKPDGKLPAALGPQTSGITPGKGDRRGTTAQTYNLRLGSWKDTSIRSSFVVVVLLITAASIFGWLCWAGRRDGLTS